MLREEGEKEKKKKKKERRKDVEILRLRFLTSQDSDNHLIGLSLEKRERTCQQGGGRERRALGDGGVGC